MAVIIDGDVRVLCLGSADLDNCIADGFVRDADGNRLPIAGVVECVPVDWRHSPKPHVALDRHDAVARIELQARPGRRAPYDAALAQFANDCQGHQAAGKIPVLEVSERLMPEYQKDVSFRDRAGHFNNLTSAQAAFFGMAAAASGNGVVLVHSKWDHPFAVVEAVAMNVEAGRRWYQESAADQGRFRPDTAIRDLEGDMERAIVAARQRNQPVNQMPNVCGGVAFRTPVTSGEGQKYGWATPLLCFFNEDMSAPRDIIGFLATQLRAGADSRQLRLTPRPAEAGYQPDVGAAAARAVIG